MYKILGADQKEYGPVSSDQLTQWIKDRRANGETLVQVEGATDWKPLSTVPEFASALGQVTPAPPSVAPGVSGAWGATDTRAAALRAVKGPAIALIVTASLGAAYYLFSGLATLAGSSLVPQQMPGNIPPELRAFIQGMQGPLAAVINLGVAALNAFVIFGAVKMLRLRSYGLAMTSCIVAMLPCQCCCLFGLPFGIWGLVILNKSAVKSAFQ